MYIGKNGFVIKKDELTIEELITLKKELVAKPLSDKKFNNGIDITFPVYIETKNKIYIPKMYGIDKYGFPEKVLSNYNGKDLEYDIPFNGTLFDYQKEPIELLLKACYEKGGGILNLQSGGGKTVCLLYILSKLKCKALIVVNKISLLKQWQNEISNFLPDASIGIIQGQKNVDVFDKDITVAMLQSLSKIDYPQELFNEYKAVIFDECHNISSRCFSKIFFKLTSKYTIGLSATPKRGDGCEYVFKWHIGDIVYESKSERKGKEPIIRTIQIDSNEYKEISTINKFTGEKQIQFTSMISELINMPKRNKLVIEMIKQCYKEKRKILVLSERRSHLISLKKLLDIDKDITFTYGLFLGSMKITDLEKSKSCDIILATFAAFSEGVSVSQLNSLILCTPKKYINPNVKNKTNKKNDSGKLVQIVGRVFRQKHININPLIIDIFDNFSVYKSQGNSRKVFYKEHFKNGIFEKGMIDLDEYLIDDITMDKIQFKQRKGQIKDIKDIEELNIKDIEELNTNAEEYLDIKECLL